MEGEEDAVLELKPSATKISRKIGEKLRRDKLNNLITQLAEEIPLIKYAHRRLDKSAVLRLTVSYLKLQYGLRKKKAESHHSFHELGVLNWLRKVTDDTLFIISQMGDILYVSNKITEMCGFYQTDMVGFNIEKFVHPSDLHAVMGQFTSAHSARNTSHSPTFESQKGMPENFEILQSNHNFFYVRMLRSQRKKQGVEAEPEYELMTMRTFFEKNTQDQDMWMVALMKPFRKETLKEVEVKISEFTKNNEFASLHDMDSTIVALDHRASLFHGYLVSEIIGQTPYMLIFDEDLESVALSHRTIMKDQETPSTIFRMNNRFGIEVYVESRSIIVNDKWTGKPKSICSVNTILEMHTGNRMLEDQKKKVAFHLELEGQKINNIPQDTHKCELHDSEYSDDDNIKCSVDSPSDILETHRSTGKKLWEIYEERARSIPDLYIDSNSSCSNGSVLAEKRAFECVESDKEDTGSETSCKSNTGMCSMDVPVQNSGVNGQSSIASASVLKDLLNSGTSSSSSISTRNITKTALNMPVITNKGTSSNIKTSAESSPLLKSILESRVAMDTVGNKCTISQGHNSQPVRSKGQGYQESREQSDCCKGAQLKSSALKDSSQTSSHVGVSCWSSPSNTIIYGDSESMDNHFLPGTYTGHHIEDVQSPTVGSTEFGTMEHMSAPTHVEIQKQLLGQLEMLKEKKS